eukprot:CAMPEP_0194037742 /NCGR_PEP_ID=MMETSP0009_2-20130614/10062_1 /TAXON_ID=210454 /ORGANISM="Grammatophora oceanica, Strain CCMP 410" /LENGTH=256 /DNA_ID=CAMNT_0038680007 /DNA_START=20 /DNA_END=790 /DNA_ORIENTATION=-
MATEGTASPAPAAPTIDKSKMVARNAQQELIIDEDPLLIAQTLTYVTDDGSVVSSYQAAPFSLSFKLRVILLEVIFILLLVAAVPIGAHGTVVAVSIVNLFLVAWFWYNLVRTVDITTDGTLRFYIGNIEIDVPFDKILSMRRVAITTPCSVVTCQPHRGFLSCPTDGVCIVTTVPSTMFWMWPRSAGKPDRSCCFGVLACPKLTVVFSPAGGGLNFIRDVENEMRSHTNGTSRLGKERVQPPSHDPSRRQDYLDV